MHAEIFLAVMVLAVALLVAADFFRRSSEGPHEHAERPAYDAGRGAFTPPAASRGRGAHGSATPVTAFEPARTGRSRQPADGGGAVPPAGPNRATGNWLVRTRLSLLTASAALAAAIATASVIRAADLVQGAAYHSDISSIRDGAAASAILSSAVAVVALAVGGWASVILIRSVLRPLNKLRTGVVELAEVRLPDALRAGGRGPLAVRSIGISSPDEIGEIARAFDRVQAEVLGVTSNEAGLRGKLGEMFVELSSRSQALVERQIRLIDELEQGEQDTGRLASLFKMDHIATRMRRSSQNLLILAGHELPGQWSQPVTLIDVIRAAVSEIEEYERVSLSAQPGIAVSGAAVSDVVHLLAELAENATSLSAAGASVDISGRSLASGGVLVDITDSGVGMNPEVLAEVNRRLDRPPAMDFAVSPNMGLFVVGRLAARHGIKVRLQPAAAGGLTALVWLPDAVASRQDGGPGVFDEGGPGWSAQAAARPGLPAGTDPDRLSDFDRVSDFDRRPAEREAVAQSMWSAPVLEDAPARQRQAPAAAYVRPGPGRHAWPDSGPQPSFHPHPPVPAEAPGSTSAFTSPAPSRSAAPARPSAPAQPSAPARPSAPAQPAALAQRLRVTPRPASAQPASAQPAPAQSTSAASAMPAVSMDEASGPQAGLARDAAEERRLPIYDAVESDWFGNRRKLPGGSAALESGWTSPADPGWGAAQAAAKPVAGGTTTAGLPVRVPRANLVPGTIATGTPGPGTPGPGTPSTGTPGGAQPGNPPLPRSASALRDRLSGFQRGTSQGRAALNRDGEDQAP